LNYQYRYIFSPLEQGQAHAKSSELLEMFIYGSYEVLLLFRAILNPRWLPWSLICCEIIDFLLWTTAWQVTKLSRNILLGSKYGWNLCI